MYYREGKQVTYRRSGIKETHRWHHAEDRKQWSVVTKPEKKSFQTQILNPARLSISVWVQQSILHTCMTSHGPFLQEPLKDIL